MLENDFKGRLNPDIKEALMNLEEANCSEAFIKAWPPATVVGGVLHYLISCENHQGSPSGTFKGLPDLEHKQRVCCLPQSTSNLLRLHQVMLNYLAHLQSQTLPSLKVCSVALDPLPSLSHENFEPLTLKMISHQPAFSRKVQLFLSSEAGQLALEEALLDAFTSPLNLNSTNPERFKPESYPGWHLTEISNRDPHSPYFKAALRFFIVWGTNILLLPAHLQALRKSSIGEPLNSVLLTSPPSQELLATVALLFERGLTLEGAYQSAAKLEST